MNNSAYLTTSRRRGGAAALAGSPSAAHAAPGSDVSSAPVTRKPRPRTQLSADDCSPDRRCRLPPPCGAERGAVRPASQHAALALERAATAKFGSTAEI